MRTTHYLHKLRIQYGRAMMVFMFDTALLCVCIFLALIVAEWLARHCPVCVAG